MWSRLRLDLGWDDLCWGLCPTDGTHDPQVDGALVCLSVRSAFDLLLGALSLPPRSEVLMSAITIPHMPAIVSAHGLVPVPIDIDPSTMAPCRSALERAYTNRTRMLVVAHLLGGRVPLDQLGAFARQHELLLVEDCAQAFDGHGCLLDDHADVALYSFGAIKTATALGGAIAQVRENMLRAAMRAKQDDYPLQPNGEHRRKLAKAAVLKLASSPQVYGAFVRLVGRRGDLDERLHAAIAGFPDDRLIELLRRQPSQSLVRLLMRRISSFDHGRVTRRTRIGNQIAADLPPPFEVAGAAAKESTHWVLPILVPDPDRVVHELRRRGFDATRWSSMIAIEPPQGHPCGAAHGARSVLDRAVFVPCYPDMSDKAVDRLGGALAAVARGS